MGDVINLNERRKALETKKREASTTDWARIAEQKKEVEERMRKEREHKNKQTLRDYRIK